MPNQFALIDIETKEVLKVVSGEKRFRTGLPPDVSHKGFRWVPFVQQATPKFDPKTEALGPLTDFLADGKVTRSRSKRALTEKEKSDQKDGDLPPIDDVMLKVAFQHENRLRALEGKAAITPAQFRSWIRSQL